MNPDALNWRVGAVGGVVGAMGYSTFIEVVNVAANGMRAFFVPFRQIGAVVLGPHALQESFDLLTAVAAGTAVHLTIAAIFGIALARIISQLSVRTLSAYFTLGLLAGLLFYVVNVVAIFPAAFPWFLDNSRLTQSIGHAIFGGITAAWMARGRLRADRAHSA